MSKKHKAGEPQLSVLRDVKEAAAIQQYWHLAERPKARKPPEDYKYVEELAHLQFELIKVQEWVRQNGLKIVVLFEGRVTREFERADADEDAIMRAATGTLDEAA